MDASALIITLSLAVLVSYAFDLFSHRFRLPAALMLLLLGILLGQLTRYLGFQLPFIPTLLPALGTLGLILIVLEGALDLELHAENFQIIRRMLLAALLGVVGGTVLLACVFSLLLTQPVYRCLLTALPFSVLSSSLAIPSVAFLKDRLREYIVYESAFSGILGVVCYNILLVGQESVWVAVGSFLRDTFLMALVSLICCFALLYLIGRINHRIKFLPIISVLLLVYALAERFHLSSLLLILIFGLFLNNTDLFVRGRLSQILKNDLFEKELETLKNLTAEGSFVVRTFFFLIFGYSAVPEQFVNVDALAVTGLIMAVILVWRWVTLRITYSGHSAPLQWVAPRGLVTVLLFMNIPESQRITGFPEGISMLVVIVSSLIMMAGLVGYRRTHRKAQALGSVGRG